ncbi:phosphoribosyltransferase [Neisseria dentiae]|uniref:Phosphoribosyltransferase n=1 Tax=Neisseria dentiae TaxID=194197 RepID=A0A1X3D234_9NEIS|nr:phosphoribosyltransferase family protein [Neisseria dentiae]OSI13836.1 phosphoribosyltransferase [Neisseria dentiae]QMT44833.1 ComF family protein [Neisseria dentiae]STZ50558.1 putative phosphoribosyltransferase [Neisseria dentiae]
MAIELYGNWTKGFALDNHMQQSIFLGHNELGHPQFDNQRSMVGEWIYQLKYRNKIQNVALLVDFILNQFKGLESLNLIVPAPFTLERANQPVQLIAQELSSRLNIPCYSILKKSHTHEPLKNIQNKSEKLEILRKCILVDDIDLNNKNILIVDDLFDSGATLEISTEKLLAKRANQVFVLAMTKTKG